MRHSRARIGRLLGSRLPCSRANVVRRSFAIKGRPDIISLIPESIFTWVSLLGTPVPPRDPNDDDGDEEEEDDHEADEDREPAVIREPDEDE